MGTIIRRPLDSLGLAAMKISIGEVMTRVAIDTCAGYNAISPLLAIQLCLNPLNEKVSIQHPIDGDSDQPIYKLEFKLESIEAPFTDEFVQMPSPFDYSLILGIPFLKRCKYFTYRGGKDLWFELEL